MIDSLKEIDRNLFLFLNGNHNPFLDDIMYLISTTFIWIPLFIFFIFYAYKKNGLKSSIIILVGLLLCVLLADQISVHLFKNVFKRFRPSHNLDIGEFVHLYLKPNGEVYKGGLYGFVSSHAANYFAMFTFVFLSFKQYSKWWIMLFFVASLIGYSRIYLGVHYPLDIIGGGILGVIIGFLVFYLSRFFNSKR